MKYYNLYIHFENSFETYEAITKILGVKPTETSPPKFEIDAFDTWWYQVIETENDSPFDFINIFLNLIEPNLNQLADLGIQKTNILIWLVYEYDKQCSLEFHPQEMKRIGENGIGLNIDCFERRT